LQARLPAYTAAFVQWPGAICSSCMRSVVPRLAKCLPNNMEHLWSGVFLGRLWLAVSAGSRATLFELFQPISVWRCRATCTAPVDLWSANIFKALVNTLQRPAQPRGRQLSADGGQSLSVATCRECRVALGLVVAHTGVIFTSQQAGSAPYTHHASMRQSCSTSTPAASRPCCCHTLPRTPTCLLPQHSSATVMCVCLSEGLRHPHCLWMVLSRRPLLGYEAAPVVSLWPAANVRYGFLFRSGVKTAQRVDLLSTFKGSTPVLVCLCRTVCCLPAAVWSSAYQAC
jgi:hypothetical protein